MRDLTRLEYPRHLHKPDRVFCVVQNADECAAALADGYTLACPPFPDSVLAMAGAIDALEAGATAAREAVQQLATVTATEPPLTESVKLRRGRGARA